MKLLTPRLLLSPPAHQYMGAHLHAIYDRYDARMRFGVADMIRLIQGAFDQDPSL